MTASDVENCTGLAGASSACPMPPDNAASATRKIRSRVKGRQTAANNSNDDAIEMSPRLHTDYSSDSDTLLGEASSRPPGATALSRPQYYLQWFQLLALSLFLSSCLYYLPGVFLEVAFFPARGRMMPNGFHGLTATPTITPSINYRAASSDTAATDDLDEQQQSSGALMVHIPRIVHVTYKSRQELPPEWEKSIEQWESMHPTWQVRFWSDKDIAKFVHQHFPEMEALWKSYKYMIQRVDSVRYMILYHFGGLYSDMDIYPATALDKLLQQWEDAGKNVLLAESFNLGVTNAFMAAAPQSTFMSCVIDNLPRYQHGFYHIIQWQHWEVLSSAGSTFLWGMVGHCQDEGVEILAARSFRGCSVCDAWETGQPAGTCDTEWLHHSSTNSSWHQHKSWFHALCFNISYSFLCKPFRACFISVTVALILLGRRKNQRRGIKT